MSAPVTVGNDVKVDYSVGIEITPSATNWVLDLQLRLYRNSTLVDTRIFIRSQTQNTIQRFPITSTQVDTVPATATDTYSLRTFVVTATNITSATAYNADINAIVFP